MTILVAQEPAGGLELIGKVVPHLLKLKPSTDRLVGGSPPKASAPLQVYTLGLNDAQHPDALGRVRFVGWRYLIDDNGTPAVADIRPREGLSPKFSNLTRGAFAQGLQQAADQATVAYGRAVETYEARILEVPALHSVSLWLHGKDDLFFQYLDSKGQIPTTIDESVHHISSIIAAAREKVAKKPFQSGVARSEL